MRSITRVSILVAMCSVMSTALSRPAQSWLGKRTRAHGQVFSTYKIQRINDEAAPTCREWHGLQSSLANHDKCGEGRRFNEHVATETCLDEANCMQVCCLPAAPTCREWYGLQSPLANHDKCGEGRRFNEHVATETCLGEANCMQVCCLPAENDNQIVDRPDPTLLEAEQTTAAGAGTALAPGGSAVTEKARPLLQELVTCDQIWRNHDDSNQIDSSNREKCPSGTSVIPRKVCERCIKTECCYGKLTNLGKLKSNPLTFLILEFVGPVPRKREGRPAYPQFAVNRRLFEMYKNQKVNKAKAQLMKFFQESELQMPPSWKFLDFIVNRLKLDEETDRFKTPSVLELPMMWIEDCLNKHEVQEKLSANPELRRRDFVLLRAARAQKGFCHPPLPGGIYEGLNVNVQDPFASDVGRPNYGLYLPFCVAGEYPKLDDSDNALEAWMRNPVSAVGLRGGGTYEPQDSWGKSGRTIRLTLVEMDLTGRTKIEPREFEGGRTFPVELQRLTGASQVTSIDETAFIGQNRLRNNHDLPNAVLPLIIEPMDDGSSWGLD